jgi:hypothetical protein
MELIDRRSGVLLDKILMVITSILQPQDWRQVQTNAETGEVGAVSHLSDFATRSFIDGTLIRV